MKMTAKKRNDLMKQYRANAKNADSRGDVVARRQASDNWRELATDSEASRAPRYLTWSGRK